MRHIKIKNRKHSARKDGQAVMHEWVVILNRIGARVLGRKTINDPLILVQKIENPLGRVRNRVMRSDRPGSDRMRFGKSLVSHSLKKEKSPHEDAAIQFVRQVAHLIDRESLKGKFKNLVIYSDAHLAGILKPFFSHTLSDKTRWVHKNLSKLSNFEVTKRLKLKPELGVNSSTKGA